MNGCRMDGKLVMWLGWLMDDRPELVAEPKLCRQAPPAAPRPQPRHEAPWRERVGQREARRRERERERERANKKERKNEEEEEDDDDEEEEEEAEEEEEEDMNEDRRRKAGSRREAGQEEIRR